MAVEAVGLITFFSVLFAERTSTLSLISNVTSSFLKPGRSAVITNTPSAFSWQEMSKFLCGIERTLLKSNGTSNCPKWDLERKIDASENASDDA